ncbi:MAG: VOC family protein [Ferruginibacter sp.]
MKLKTLRPMLWTEQFTGTIEFYTTTLGFVCDERNDEWEWASLHKDDVAIMVARPNAQTIFEKPVFTGSFYINTEDVDVLWDHLKGKVNVAYHIETFEWGMREFAIYDNNGYLLQFGQDVQETQQAFEPI